MKFSNVKYYYDPENTNSEYGIKGDVDGNSFSLVAGSMNNRYYAEILRQVEAGTLTIADAD